VTNHVPPPVLVLMGVSGGGKTTIAEALAERLGWDYAEGDVMHPAANIAKMSAGIPLTDEDRQPWLARIADWISAQTAAGKPGIVTCSALKRSYRDVLRGENVIFVYLKGSYELIASRLAERTGHFMPPSLLRSQFATLEEPGEDENAITVDIGGSTAQTTQAVLDRLDKAVPGYSEVSS
jgi:gluconokinase/shikimate kinase